MSSRTSSPSHRRAALVALAALAALLLGGCGEDSTPAATSSGTSTSTATSTGSAEGATAVTITETENTTALSQNDFTAGKYVFTYTNSGQLPHSVAIKGPGVDEVGPPVPSGQGGEISVTLTAGTYEIWCTVGNHKGRGMDTNITVT